VIDASNPAAPTEVGVFEEWDPYDSVVAISGHHALVALSDLDGVAPQELHVIDLTDPGDLIEVSTVRTDCPIEGLTVSGDGIYVAEGDCGFSVYRLLSPCAEEWLASGYVR
jgi:hypothetical protein